MFKRIRWKRLYKKLIDLSEIEKANQYLVANAVSLYINDEVSKEDIDYAILAIPLIQDEIKKLATEMDKLELKINRE